MDAITGCFQTNWPGEGLGCVGRTTVKKYDAEIHSQTAIEAVLMLLRQYQFSSTDIERVDVEIFDVAYNIIGGGEEGDKAMVSTKEQADHSLPYILAVAILDGQVMPGQYEQERILRADVQALLGKVSVQPNERFSERFPNEMPCRVKITLKDGRVLEQETTDYEGFLHTSDVMGHGRSRSSIRLPPRMQVRVNVPALSTRCQIWNKSRCAI